MTETDVVNKLFYQILIGDKLRKWRINHGLTQNELGEKLMVSGSTVAGIEHGRYGVSGYLAIMIKRTCNITITGYDECYNCNAKGTKSGRHFLDCASCGKRRTVFLTRDSSIFYGSNKCYDYCSMYKAAVDIYHANMRLNAKEDTND